jgi:hypothetical protein
MDQFLFQVDVQFFSGKCQLFLIPNIVCLMEKIER